MTHKEKALAVAHYAAELFSEKADEHIGFIFATIRTDEDANGEHEIWFFSNMSEGLGTAMGLIYSSVCESEAKGNIKAFHQGIAPNVSDIGHGD